MKRIILIWLLVNIKLISAQIIEIDPNSIIIKAKPGFEADMGININAQSASSYGGILSQTGAQCSVVQGCEADGLYTISIAESAHKETLMSHLSDRSDIEFVQPNHIYRTQLTPNDPLVNDQYHINLLNMPDAWNISTGNKNIVIAVIDTGAKIDHVDLKNQLWVNTGEIPNNNVDDDGNGFVDDVNGYNFAEKNALISDSNGHGTHVSGIAVAQTNNGLVTAGMGFNCSLMVLKASRSDENSFRESDLLSAMTYAINNGADIINMSLGGFGNSPLLEEKIEEAVAAGILVVVAAGNRNVNLDSVAFFPANVAAAITVSASDQNGEFDNTYSNYGSVVDIMAPGTSVVSLGLSTTRSAAVLTGTSMSAPMVSGALGLLKAFAPNADPTLLIQALKATATDKGLGGVDSQSGAGLINPFRALEYLQDPQLNTSVISGDFANTDSIIEYTVFSVNPIVENSIVVTINGTAFTTSDSAITFTSSISGGTLLINLNANNILSSNTNQQINIALSMQDSAGNIQTDSLSLNRQIQFALYGPTGVGTSPIFGPNPFDPAITPTYIGFQITKSADIKIEIFTLNLEKVFEYTGTVGASYNSISWDGKDFSGRIVPNGVYVMILKATSLDGEEITKRQKIAVLKNT